MLSKQLTPSSLAPPTQQGVNIILAHHRRTNQTPSPQDTPPEYRTPTPEPLSVEEQTLLEATDLAVEMEPEAAGIDVAQLAQQVAQLVLQQTTPALAPTSWPELIRGVARGMRQHRSDPAQIDRMATELDNIAAHYDLVPNLRAAYDARANNVSPEERLVQGMQQAVTAAIRGARGGSRGRGARQGGGPPRTQCDRCGRWSHSRDNCYATTYSDGRRI